MLGLVAAAALAAAGGVIALRRRRSAVAVSGRGCQRLPRDLHPGAWWLWALGLAAAASRTTNPLLLALVLAVVAHGRRRAPDRRAVGARASSTSSTWGWR